MSQEGRRSNSLGAMAAMAQWANRPDPVLDAAMARLLIAVAASSCRTAGKQCRCRRHAPARRASLTMTIDAHVTCACHVLHPSPGRLQRTCRFVRTSSSEPKP